MVKNKFTRVGYRRETETHLGIQGGKKKRMPGGWVGKKKEHGNKLWDTEPQNEARAGKSGRVTMDGKKTISSRRGEKAAKGDKGGGGGTGR